MENKKNAPDLETDFFLEMSGLPTVGIIEIIKENIITEKIIFTNKLNFLCIRHRINYCFAIPTYIFRDVRLVTLIS